MKHTLDSIIKNKEYYYGHSEIIEQLEDVGLHYNQGESMGAPYKELRYEYTVSPDFMLEAGFFDNDKNTSEEEFLRDGIPEIIKTLELQINTLEAEVRYLKEAHKRIFK